MRLCPHRTLPHGKAGPGHKTLCCLQRPKIPVFFPLKTHVKPYLEAVGVPIAFADGIQGVFIIQRRPLVGRHLRGGRSAKGTERQKVEEEEEEGGRGRNTHPLKPPPPPGS